MVVGPVAGPFVALGGQGPCMALPGLPGLPLPATAWAGNALAWLARPGKGLARLARAGKPGSQGIKSYSPGLDDIFILNVLQLAPI